jgi:hypothetical protein
VDDLRFDTVCHGVASVSLRMQEQGCDSDTTHGLDTDFQWQDDLARPVDWQLEFSLQITLLD